MPTATIESQIPTEDTATGQPATAILQADLTTPQVAGGMPLLGAWAVWMSYANSIALPHLTDDREWLNPDVYLEMTKDPKVKSEMRTLILEALSTEGRTVLPVKETDADYALADEYRRFIDACFSNLDESLGETLRTQAEGAFVIGNSLAELVIEIPTSGEWANTWLLKEWMPKPRRSFSYVVDRFMRLLGVLSLVNLMGLYGSWQQSVEGDNPNLLPPEKFALLQFLSPVGVRDPRGQSWLQSAYLPWWRKLQTIGERMLHVGALAGARIFIKINEKTPPTVSRLQADGSYKDIDTAQEVIDMVSQTRNGGIIASQHDVSLLVAEGGGAMFLEVEEDEDRHLSECITGQSLSTHEAEGSKRGDTGEHTNVRQLSVYWLRFCLEQTVNSAIRRLVEWNYGPERVSLAPTWTLADTPREDLPATKSANAKLLTAGGIDPEQYPEMDVQNGFAPRSQEAVERALERQEQGSQGPGGEPDGDEEDDTEDDSRESDA